MRVLLFLIGLLTYSSFATADYGVSMAFGRQAFDDPAMARLSITKSFDVKWFDSGDSYLTGNYEFSRLYWEQTMHNDIHGYSINPVFRYVWEFDTLNAFVEAGIGATWITDKYFEDRELGSKWTFEDKIAFGMTLAKHHEISTVWIHYSNASTRSENDGVNMIALAYSYRF